MVKISADSTCDLSQELIQRYAITIQPLYITKDDRSFLDGVEIFPEDIFAHVEQTGRLCKTSAVSVEDYTALFKRLTQDGSEVVHLHISSEMSACYQNACLAAQEVPGVYPVDSRSLSTGIGHLAIEGAKLAAQGASGAQIQEALNQLAPRLEVSFVIERLDYLYKGGRCSAVAALGANLLHLKPCIEVRDGKMGVGRKYRGSWQKALGEYVRDRLEGRSDIVDERCFLTYSTCDAQTLKMVHDAIEKYHSFKEILVTQAGGTICNHCGPNTLGILFIRKA